MGVILGVLDKSRTESELETELLRAAARLSQGKENTQFTAWHNRFLAFCWVPSEIDTLDKASQPFATWDQSIVSLFEGKLYNGPEIDAAIGSAYVFDKSRSGEALGYLYERYGKSFLHRMNGKFAFALWDERNQKLLLGRDRLGIEPLFYCNDGKRLVFSSSLRALLATGWVNKVLNYEAVLQYLAYCYNPGLETFLQGVTKLPAGHLLSIDGSGMSVKRYWRLNFGETQVRTEGQYRDEILGLMQDAIRICLDSHRSPGILLSGGNDSRTIVSLASRMSNEPLRTFL